MAKRATRGPRRHPGLVVVRRPDREQRVACELHDLTAMLVDQPDQLAEAVVQQLGERLDTARPGASQPLGKHRETRDVGEQDRRQEPLALCLTQSAHADPQNAGRRAREHNWRARPGRRQPHAQLEQPAAPRRSPQPGAPRARRCEAPEWVLEWFAAQCDLREVAHPRCCTPCRRPCRQSSRAMWVVQMVEQWVGRAAVARPSAGPAPAGGPVGWCSSPGSWPAGW